MNENNIVIETKDLTKRFGHFTAVDHITFNVHECASKYLPE